MILENLGRTDIKVSKICLGTMTFGEQNTEAEGHEQMDHALDNGVNFLDTAEMYAIPSRRETQGSTERIIGAWLRARKNRDKVVLATKIVGPGGFDYIRGGDIKHNAEQIEEAVEGSLKRLGRTISISIKFTGPSDRPISSANWATRTREARRYAHGGNPEGLTVAVKDPARYRLSTSPPGRDGIPDGDPGKGPRRLGATYNLRKNCSTRLPPRPLPGRLRFARLFAARSARFPASTWAARNRRARD